MHIKTFLKIEPLLYKALIKFILRILCHRCKYFRDHLTCIGLTFMLKEGKPPYAPIKDEYNGNIITKLPMSVKNADPYLK